MKETIFPKEVEKKMEGKRKEFYGFSSYFSSKIWCMERYFYELLKKYPQGGKKHIKKTIMGATWLEAKEKNIPLEYLLYQKKEILPDEINGYIMECYNHQCNCGGYALDIWGCVFSSSNMIMTNAVTLLLREYGDFLRIYDGKLYNDEHLVYYRCGKSGHHFVRNDNGNLTDKWDCHPVQVFSGWDTLKNDPETIFAVKKHDFIRKTIYVD